MKTTYDFIKEIVRKNKEIHGLYFREYSYPAKPVGTRPALADKVYPVGREDYLNNLKFQTLRSKLSNNRNIGIESKVNTPQGDLHIPMMDFSLSKSSQSLNMIKKLWNKAMIKHCGRGGLLETDNSYHFIGNRKLLNESEYQNFLGWCLLLVYKDDKGDIRNIVDVPYIAYCMLKRSSCLRITKYPNSKTTPSLVYSF